MEYRGDGYGMAVQNLSKNKYVQKTGKAIVKYGLPALVAGASPLAGKRIKYMSTAYGLYNSYLGDTRRVCVSRGFLLLAIMIQADYSNKCFSPLGMEVIDTLIFWFPVVSVRIVCVPAVVNGLPGLRMVV